MSEVTILTPALQARTGQSEAFDASGFSTLRLDLTAHANLGSGPFVRAFVETAESSGGPWRTIAERHYTASAAPGDERQWPPRGKDRIVLAGFDAFVRLRWEAGREFESTYSSTNAGEAPTPVDIQMTLGLTGDGQPDAE